MIGLISDHVAALRSTKKLKPNAFSSMLKTEEASYETRIRNQLKFKLVLSRLICPVNLKIMRHFDALYDTGEDFT